MPEAQKMVMVVIDTLRADRLGCYGYEKPTSPAVDALAAEGVLFETVHSASPWTAPSFGTIFTGVSPTVHGAGALLAKGHRSGVRTHGVTVGGIRKDLPTMAGLMPKGVKTAAFITNSFVSAELGMDRGFRHYDHRNAGNVSYRKADVVTNNAIEWLAENGEAPFFLLLHYFDPHMGYGPPKRYIELLAPDKPPRIPIPFTDHGSARDGSLNPSDEDKRFISGLYDGEVRFVDDQIARVVEFLGTQGRLDDTWIVVVSDHGEEIFDHGSFDHGHAYYEEVTRVPLILRAPGGRWQAGQRVEASVRHVDLLPTVLALYDQPPLPHFEGKSLIPVIEGADTRDRPAYIEFNLFGGQQCALFDGRRKIVWDTWGKKGYFFDLMEDPGEQNRLDSKHPTYRKLYKELRAVRKRLEDASRGKVFEKGALSEEAAEALKSLGYIE